MHAYDELYLYDAMRTLASAFDFVANICDIDLDSFMSLFIASKLSETFEIGFPRVVSGLSGPELAMEVFSKVGFEYVLADEEPDYDSSPEYWCGWIVAYYQWKTGRSFKDIQSLISMNEILSLYFPLHEASEDKCVETLESIMKERTKASKLQLQRKKACLTQKALAEKAEINLRTLQQYELGSKDLNKASVQTVRNLTKVLGCCIEDII